MDDITYAVSVDVNNPTIPYNVYIASVLDSNVRYLEITLYQNGNVIALSDTATATASLVTDNVLVDDSVNCTISDNIITVPLEDLQRHGNLDVQVTVIEGTKVLAIPFPIQVRVTPNIAEEAQVDENSMGSYAEVVQELANARGDYVSLSEALNHKLSSAAGAVKTVNIDTGAVTEAKLAANSVTTAKIKDGNVTEAKLAAAFKDTLHKVNTTDQQPNYATCDAKTIYVGAKLGNERGIIIPFFGKDKQMFIGVNGTICVRHYTGGNDYQDWESNLSELTANKKAVINSSNQASTAFFPSIKAVVDYIAALFATVINNDNKSSNALLPTIKAVVDYLTANYTDTTALNSALSGKMDVAYAEDIRYKLEEFGDTAPDPDDEKYPSAIAVWNFVNDAFSKLYIKHSQNYAKISDLQAYLGYTSPDILGLCVDLENNRFTRLAGAVGKTAGSDFDAFPMFGGRRRVIVDSSGAIQTAMDPDDITAGDTDYDVMVYQPKFYYRMVPIKLEKQTNGLGYHIRKANYYITATPHAGFKVHPLFLDAGGNEVDYVLLSAFEASYLDGSRYFNDDTDTEASISGTAVLKSMPGVKPISGKYKSMTKANMEMLAQRKSANWHLDTIQSVSANQLLMMVEFGVMNIQGQDGLGLGNTNKTGIPESNNGADPTGTAQPAASTGTTAYSVASAPVCYRWMENPYGNIWKHANGINLWGDGHMGGGQVFVCDDFSFDESKHDGNYRSAGFTISNSSGYVSAFGYGDEEFDWLFMPSETTGNNALPVGDYSFGNANLNGLRITFIGGRWANGGSGDFAGLFLLNSNYGPGRALSFIGGRLLFVPTATV